MVRITSTAGPYFVGNNVDLDCEVDEGNPPPTQKWLRDSVEAGMAARLSFVASVDDDGKVYQCDGINTVDTISQSITLQVFCMIKSMNSNATAG